MALFSRRSRRVPGEDLPEGMFVLSGLAERTKSRGTQVEPLVVADGVDDAGRPFFVAEYLRGIHTLDTWTKAAPRLASAWHVHAVQVTPEGTGQVRVTALPEPRERVAGDAPVMWEPAPVNVPAAAYVSALPMGEYLDAPGVPYVLNLNQTHLLMGGNPGSGKSALMSALLAHLARHPDVQIAYADLKFGMESGVFAPRLAARATTPEEAVELLQRSHAALTARGDDLARRGIRNVWTQDGAGAFGPDMPLMVLVVDEVHALFSDTSTKEGRDLAARAEHYLKQITALGRAAGVVVIMATQEPLSASMPTQVRRLANSRIALHVTEYAAAAAILGDAWQRDEQAPSPVDIDEDARGEAVVKERGTGRKHASVQTAWLPENDVPGVIAQTASYRREWLPVVDDDEPVAYGVAATVAEMLPQVLAEEAAERRALPPAPQLVKVDDGDEWEDDGLTPPPPVLPSVVDAPGRNWTPAESSDVDNTRIEGAATGETAPGTPPAATQTPDTPRSGWYV